jgi:hypothetical protein
VKSARDKASGQDNEDIDAPNPAMETVIKRESYDRKWRTILRMMRR